MMAENSKIEWTDNTMNFWVGCTKLSAACDFCYAESWAKRAGHPELWSGDRRRTADANWRKPRKWNGQAKATGIRLRVFTNSLADFFDNQADEQWRADAWALIRDTPNLDWQILTKRPQNIAKMLPPDWGDGYPHVWLGTTIENREEKDKRLSHLIGVPCAVRFLSCEPLLSDLDLSVSELLSLDWVIAGGESGGNARPMHPDWARSLRDQCVVAGVPFLFKQWGEYAPLPDKYLEAPSSYPGNTNLSFHPTGEEWMARIGKKRAGRLLDGRTWDEFPAVSK